MAAMLISSIIFARWQHASRSWSCQCIWDPHFGGGDVVGVSDGTIVCSARCHYELSYVAFYQINMDPVLDAFVII